MKNRTRAGVTHHETTVLQVDLSKPCNFRKLEQNWNNSLYKTESDFVHPKYGPSWSVFGCFFVCFLNAVYVVFLGTVSMQQDGEKIVQWSGGLVGRMAFLDNPTIILAHIRQSHVTSDDTGMCEMVLIDHDVDLEKFNPSSTYGDSASETQGSNGETQGYVYSQSVDITSSWDFGIRRRSNTGK